MSPNFIKIDIWLIHEFFTAKKSWKQLDDGVIQIIDSEDEDFENSEDEYFENSEDEHLENSEDKDSRD